MMENMLIMSKWIGYFNKAIKTIKKNQTFYSTSKIFFTRILFPILVFYSSVLEVKIHYVGKKLISLE